MIMTLLSSSSSSACYAYQPEWCGGLPLSSVMSGFSSRTVNQGSSACLEAIPKADGGYYIYIPDWSYTDIYGAIPASPACGNDDEDEESEICSGGFLWDDDKNNISNHRIDEEAKVKELKQILERKFICGVSK